MRTPIRLAPPNIVDVLRDPQSFGGLQCFRDLSSWTRWIVLLKAVYGLPMDETELPIFQHHTGRTAPLPGGYPTTVIIVGRQSGKTRIAATVAAYEALVAPHVPDQEREFALMVSQDERGALRTLFSYAKAPFTRPQLKAALLGKPKKDTFDLRNGLTIACYPCRPEAVRGPRARVAICDEFGHFIATDGHPTDQEMLRAIRYTLQKTQGKLFILSSPNAQYGSLYSLHQQWFANEKASTLVWRGTAPEMNPTLDLEALARQQVEDPEGFRSEILAEFRSARAALFDGAALDACVVAGLQELVAVPGRYYFAFIDCTGGRGDAMALCIGHVEADDYVVIDCLRSWPNTVKATVAEVATVLAAYGLDTVVGDNWGQDTTVDLFRQTGLTYDASPMNRSQLYLNLLPLINTHVVRLLDHPQLLRELRSLERKPGQQGHDKVDHRRGGHDDLANVVAGCAVFASLLNANPTTPVNELGRAEYQDLRRAFPFLIEPEPYGGWSNYVEDDTGNNYEGRDMRWRRNGRPLW